VKDASKLPENLSADEKHSKISGGKTYGVLSEKTYLRVKPFF
jgi:hypothetical protein